jgi:hypothetical protein
MTSYVSHTTADCADPYALSRWWQTVLDYGEDPDDPNEPGDEECMIYSRNSGHRLLFIEVPDQNRSRTGSTWTCARSRARATRNSPG